MTCFAIGTKIATKRGEVAVQDLKSGDLVLTRDNGYQPVRRISTGNVSARKLLDNPHLRPVMVQVGAFGADMPKRDTMMAPNMRLPIIEDSGRFLAREVEELVSLKNLIDHKGVQQLETIGMSYIHVGFAKHQIIAANGIWVESFQPSDRSLGAKGNAQRLEALELVPVLEIHCRPAAKAKAKKRVSRLKFASGF